LSLNVVYLDEKNKMIKTIEFGEDVVDSYKEYQKVLENIINNEWLTDSEKISAIVKKFQNRKEFIPKLAEMNVFAEVTDNKEILEKTKSITDYLLQLSESNKNEKLLDKYIKDLNNIYGFYLSTLKEVKFNG